MPKMFGNGVGIEARQTANGLRFRAVDGSTDKYITKKMTESDIKRWLLNQAINAVINEFHLTIDASINRAIETGRSNYLKDPYGDNEPYTINEPWDKDKE